METLTVPNSALVLIMKTLKLLNRLHPRQLNVVFPETFRIYTLVSLAQRLLMTHF